LPSTYVLVESAPRIGYTPDRPYVSFAIE
jgi:hypothetical protein